jgi:hypothetical protein
MMRDAGNWIKGGQIWTVVGAVNVEGSKNGGKTIFLNFFFQI